MLSTSDPYYRAEIVPASISAMAGPLRAAYGVGPDAFGDKGNTKHTSGYHRSRAWILHSPDSAHKASDYSVLQALDKGGSDNWVSAFDFTPGAWGTPDNRAKMIVLTKRLRAAARAGDPRLADWREFAGTEDGRTVVTFSAQGGGSKDPFDPSHLDHIHGSAWRSRAADDHQGVLGVLLGIEGTDDMTDSALVIDAAFNVAAILRGTSPEAGSYKGQPNAVATKLDQILAQLAAPAPVTLTDAQLDALADKVAAKLGEPLTVEDIRNNVPSAADTAQELARRLSA